jgi:hypothetical protein
MFVAPKVSAAGADNRYRHATMTQADDFRPRTRRTGGC